MEKTYLRPKTRGELYEKLQEGVECEVVSSQRNITPPLLQSLAIIKKESLEIDIRFSENIGWDIYKKND
jgi:hypothetical protein